MLPTDPSPPPVSTPPPIERVTTRFPRTNAAACAESHQRFETPNAATAQPKTTRARADRIFSSELSRRDDATRRNAPRDEPNSVFIKAQAERPALPPTC